MPGICTDRILETADRLSAAQLLLWLGWKATPGAHPDTVTSLCSAEFTSCLLCCVNNAGRAVGLPSAALLQQHRAHTSPKRSPNAARHDLAAAACLSPMPSTRDQPLSCLLQASGSCDGSVQIWDPHTGCSCSWGLCVLGKKLMLPPEKLCQPRQDTQTWKHSHL